MQPIEIDINSDNYIKLHSQLFNHYREEVIFHKHKIRFYLTTFFSVSAAILIFKTADFFEPLKPAWSIIIGAGIVYLGIYYGLYHHTTSVMILCMNRNHEEWHLRMILGNAISKADTIAENKILGYNSTKNNWVPQFFKKILLGHLFAGKSLIAGIGIVSLLTLLAASGSVKSFYLFSL